MYIQFPRVSIALTDTWGKRICHFMYPLSSVVFKYVSHSVGKNLLANSGDSGSILGSRRSPGEGIGNLLQYSYLGNLMDRGAWWAVVHGVARESDMKSQLNSNNCL